MEKNTTKRIFQTRVKKHYCTILDLYKRTVDWVTWLYLIIPAAVISFYQYIEWWQTPWEWKASEIQFVSLLFLFFFIYTGNIRLFIEKGDQLFYRQYEKKFYYLMKLGMAYSSLVNFILTTVIFIILAPILIVQLNYPIFITIALLFFISISRFLVTTIKQIVHARFSGWQFYIVYSCFILLSAVIYSWILYVWFSINDKLLIILSIFILLVLNLLLLIYKLHQRDTFEEDLTREIKLKYRFMTYALQSASLLGAPKYEKLKVMRKKKRSWLFRNSGSIFFKRTTQSAFIEIYIKYLLRSKDRRMVFLQLIGGIQFAIILAPDVIKWIIWILTILIILQMSNYYVTELKKATFLKLFDWDNEKLFHYTSKAVFVVNLPIIFIIGAVGGALLIDAWWGFLILGLGSICITYLIQPFMQK
ncbi:ABC transporter permease [Evansella sp. AB-P1]|uniref:ABC transporter permease n=1 Tax=Evansella sp. AB-P1 TaxID=3037653 RepID=UPI00241BE682|nr:ABC transporter permease [Evansella sp. AB-P1]MDG5786340.1 ABC transporter permease [Evansella sp. AB-P1]